ncbi:hypothetical protein [Oceanibium sediminis]|uniref:hypothetical protein n=1 Tax=Oceanibium sediminis TaxID=2026339 RepID=UPI0013005F04|nr:hypothetical protein [Oceanibium sediminis]
MSLETGNRYRGMISPPEYPGGGIDYTVQLLPSNRSDAKMAQLLIQAYGAFATIRFAGQDNPVGARRWAIP